MSQPALGGAGIHLLKQPGSPVSFKEQNGQPIFLSNLLFTSVAVLVRLETDRFS